MRKVKLCDVIQTFFERVHLSLYRKIFMKKNIFKRQLFIITYIMAQTFPLINTKVDEPGPKTDKNTSVEGSSKSIPSRYMDKPWGFSVSNKKRDELQKMRKHEIQRQDKALNNRMVAITERSRNRIHSDIEAIYLKNSLHQGARKQFNKIVNQENYNNKKRLQSLKPTINIKKLEKEWEKKQVIKKNLEKYYSKQAKNRSMSIELKKLANLQFDDQKMLRYCKERHFGESKVLIKVEQYHHAVLISGYMRQIDLTLYLIVQKEKVSHILDEDCKQKVQLLGSKLRFDTQTNSLYLIPQNAAKVQRKEYFISSKIDEYELKKLRNQMKKQHIQIQSLMKKEQAKSATKKTQQIGSVGQKNQEKVESEKI